MQMLLHCVTKLFSARWWTYIVAASISSFPLLLSDGATCKTYSSMLICLLYPQVKEGLGGNVRIILSGAAPLATHVEAFLRVVACCHVLQGYGMPSLNIQTDVQIAFSALLAFKFSFNLAPVTYGFLLLAGSCSLERELADICLLVV